MFKNIIREYRESIRGATITAFALVFPVIVGGLGVSVDLARSYLIHERLTHSLDAAALAGAGSPGLSSADLNARINAYFRKNFQQDGNSTPVELIVMNDGAVLRVAGAVRMDSTFLQVLGISEVEMDSHSVVQREVRGLEVAMVLDVTGSMSTNNNIGTLRTAASNFTDIICPGTNCANMVKIGLVPFATTVNVGPYGLGKNPNNTTYDTPFVNNPLNLSFNQSSSTAWWGCILEQAPDNDVVDSESSWRWNMYRYVTSGGSTTTPNNNCNKAYILPLTDKKSTVKSRISALQATGNTLSNIGMVWGYRVLSPSFPFREGVEFNHDRINKVAILMTDGDNNIGNSYSAYGPWSIYRLTDEGLNRKLATTCQNMKEDGITIYTITFTSGIDDRTKTYFRNCASDLTKYYDAPTQPQLVTVFQRIAAELSNLYIME